MAMTLLRRVLDRTKASLQDRMGRMEDPRGSLESALSELEREMESVERTAAVMIGTERELLSRLEDAAFLSGELGLRAAQAAEEGRGYAARQMLEEKRHYDDVIAEVRARYQDARSRVQELVEKLYGMKEQAFELRKQLQPPAK
jgi:phage shock protein A